MWRWSDASSFHSRWQESLNKSEMIATIKVSECLGMNPKIFHAQAATHDGLSIFPKETEELKC
jgi:hypothetical protein